MALPTLSARWGPMSMEKRWQNHHENKHRHHQHWNDVVKYHSETSLRSSWSSRSDRIHNDHNEGNDKKGKKNSNIHIRRLKLAKVLQEEMNELESELVKIKVEKSSSNLDLLKERTDELKSAREEKNRKVAQEKLYEHWKINNPDLRALDSELHQEHVKETWGIQKQHQRACEEEEKENDQRFANEFEEARINAIDSMKRLEDERRKAEKERAEVLKTQMKELQERAKQSEQLQLEEAKLLREQMELEKMEEKRKVMKKHTEQKELGAFLHRQYKAQMRNRAREVQEELELDQQILEKIMEDQKKEEELKSARQEKAKQDVKWMKHVMEQQLKLEKEREAELDLMYREEARQVWEKREHVWQKEREAREMLVKEVLDERANQLAFKLEENKQKQQELLKERSELISIMEEAKESSERDKKAQEEMKLQQKNILQEQVTSRKEKTARYRNAVLEEQQAEKEAEHEYHEFLDAEAQRRRSMGYQQNRYGRRRVAWD